MIRMAVKLDPYWLIPPCCERLKSSDFTRKHRTSRVSNWREGLMRYLKEENQGAGPDWIGVNATRQFSLRRRRLHSAWRERSEGKPGVEAFGMIRLQAPAGPLRTRSSKPKLGMETGWHVQCSWLQLLLQECGDRRMFTSTSNDVFLPETQIVIPLETGLHIFVAIKLKINFERIPIASTDIFQLLDHCLFNS